MHDFHILTAIINPWWLKSAIFYLLFPSQSVEKLFPIISYDYLSQPTPSLGQREPAFSPCNHAQYCPSTADRVVIFVFKQGYTLGKISSLFKKDLEMIILRNNSHGGIIRVCMGIFTTALRNKKIRQVLKKKYLTLLPQRIACYLTAYFDEKNAF